MRYVGTEISIKTVEGQNNPRDNGNNNNLSMIMIMIMITAADVEACRRGRRQSLLPKEKCTALHSIRFDSMTRDFLVEDLVEAVIIASPLASNGPDRLCSDGQSL